MADSSPDFYLEAGSKLSQGDIVKDVPWGRIPNPLLVCRPANQGAEAGKAYYAPSTKWKQGGPAFGDKRVEEIHARANIGIAMVLWHDCEIDKFEEKGQPPEKWFAAIAPILQPAGFPPDVWKGVEAGERLQYFYLPALPAAGISAPSYVDLRLIWAVSQSLLTARVATLGVTARRALYDQLFSFFTRRRLRDAVLCPNCAETVKAEELFEPMADD